MAGTFIQFLSIREYHPTDGLRTFPTCQRSDMETYHRIEIEGIASMEMA